MTRANARELAVHLIYAREFTDDDPEMVIATRMEKEYYCQLSAENPVYEDRPSRVQRAYIDSVVIGIGSSHKDYLTDGQFRKHLHSLLRF